MIKIDSRIFAPGMFFVGGKILKRHKGAGGGTEKDIFRIGKIFYADVLVTSANEGAILKGSL